MQSAVYLSPPQPENPSRDTSNQQSESLLGDSTVHTLTAPSQQQNQNTIQLLSLLDPNGLHQRKWPTLNKDSVLPHNPSWQRLSEQVQVNALQNTTQPSDLEAIAGCASDYIEELARISRIERNAFTDETKTYAEKTRDLEAVIEKLNAELKGLESRGESPKEAREARDARFLQDLALLEACQGDVD